MWLEDLTPGRAIELGSYQFTPDNIRAFAGAYDPQPFHLDEAAGRASLFGGLAASGWHVAAVWMKLTVATFARQAREDMAAGRRPASPGPSPGFNNLRWLKPVLAGDVLTYRSEVVTTRETKSRPGWGLVTLSNTATNQRGERVFSFEAQAFWPSRPADAA